MTQWHLPAWLRIGWATLVIGCVALAAQQPDRPQRPRTNEDGERFEKVGPTMSRVIPQNTPYDRWLAEAKSRIPMFSGLVVDDARTVPLKPWPDMGVNGLYIRMADYQIIDGLVLEIPTHGRTKPQRHMFEEGIYFFGGPGHTIINKLRRRPEGIDWKYRC